jgi:HAD superfamily hydrolase (TIGR01509 family)
MIRTIFFDLDGVLTMQRTGSLAITDNIHRMINGAVQKETIYQCYRKQRKGLLHGTKRLNDVWGEFCACCGVSIPFMPEEILGNAQKNKTMFDLCAALKSHYRLGIITDNAEERFIILSEEMNLKALFDYCIVSGSVGSTKRDVKIFERALHIAKAAPEECIFIDNDAENLLLPARMGMKTIFYDFEANDLKPILTALKNWKCKLAKYEGLTD